MQPRPKKNIKSEGEHKVARKLLDLTVRIVSSIRLVEELFLFLPSTI